MSRGKSGLWGSALDLGVAKKTACTKHFHLIFFKHAQSFTPCGFLNRWKTEKALWFFFFIIFFLGGSYFELNTSQHPPNSLVTEKLRVFDVKEIPFGWRCPSIPGTRVIVPLDASKVLSLLSVYCPLDHPVQPQALRRTADGARDGRAASNLKIRRGTNRKYWLKCWRNQSFLFCKQTGLYPAITAHCVVLSQALLLGGTCGLPGHDEVAECDVHRPVGLKFALGAKESTSHLPVSVANAKLI